MAPPMSEGYGGKNGRNGPRAAGGDNYSNGGGWAADSWNSGYQKNAYVDNAGGGGKNGGYQGANTNGGKNGSYRDSNGGGGGKGGGYQNGGGNGWAPSIQAPSGTSYGNSGQQRSGPGGAASPAGGQRSSPFGAAGPASPFGAAGPGGPSTNGQNGGYGDHRPAEPTKYVPPAMRNGGAWGNADEIAAAYNDSHTKGYDGDNGRYGAGQNNGNSKGDQRGGKDSRGGKDNRGGKDSGKGGKGERGYNGNEDSRYGAADKGSKGKANSGGKGESKGDAGKAKGKGESKGDAGKNGNGKGRKGGNGDFAPNVPDRAGDSAPAASYGKARSGGSGAVTSTHLSDDKFANLQISRETKTAMSESFGYELMTQVQAEAIPPLLNGQDVVARARTGTGKTLAFMIPIVEIIREYPGGVGGNIGALVLSPTRELAQQIHDEAMVLLEYHRKLGIMCFYGGTPIKGDHRKLSSQPCDILVATPGRIQDHLDNTPGFSRRFAQLSVLCLDEADQLLETGFRDAILKIIGFLPAPAKRQGALFSATFPPSVDQITKLALRPTHQWINTVTDEVTPDQIAQSCAIGTIDTMTELLWGALSSEMARNPKTYKIMVFFVAARVTQIYSEIFNAAGTEVHEIHSRKSQAHRTKCANAFRNGQRGIIFSSDVLARGLDFPDVTAVIQVGLPSARDQYIHRLGRTGRAGKSGGCILLLHDFEQYFLKQVSDLPIKRLAASNPFPTASAPSDALWWQPDRKSACQAYQAWLGYYNSAKGLGWKKEHLVNEAYRFAESICAIGQDGLAPPIMKKTVGKMGLKGVPGLNLVNQLDYEE